jgi:hypothetical protein
VNGRLFAHNCFGDLHLTAAHGGVDIYYDWWDDQQKFAVEAEVVDGSARVFIPADASFHLIAQAENGHIANDFADKEQRHAGSLHKVDTVIGTNPKIEVRLRAQSGNIKVTEVSY